MASAKLGRHIERIARQESLAVLNKHVIPNRQMLIPKISD